MLFMLLKESLKLLLDYLIMMQHTGRRKQKVDLLLVTHHLKQL